jgi:hypothetical protein
MKKPRIFWSFNNSKVERNHLTKLFLFVYFKEFISSYSVGVNVGGAGIFNDYLSLEFLKNFT